MRRSGHTYLIKTPAPTVSHAYPGVKPCFCCMAPSIELRISAEAYAG